ncbi:MAG TPA: MFS transporter [Puia sp.]|jgi:predicted MFS family arabinose efflux permease|nr:MFS transporter [Puia sp.]
MNLLKPLNATRSLYINAYSGLSRSTWLLSLVMLVNRSGTMVLPFMTIYLTGIGFSLIKAGFVVGLFGAGAVCGAVIGGKLTDKIGFRQIQLITLAGGGVLFILLGFMKSYPLICVFTFVLSLVNDAFRPANNAAIAQYSKPENRTRSYSLNRLAINLGWAVGGTLGGFIASFNYHLLFWIDGFTNIFAAVMLYYLLKPAAFVVKEKISVNRLNEKNSPLKDRKFALFLILVLLYGLCFYQLYSTIPVYYKDVYQMSELQIGILMGLNGLIIVIIEMVLIFYLESKNKTLTFISNGLLLTSISFLVYVLMPRYALTALISVFLVTFGEILAMPFMNNYWAGRASSQNRGQYAGYYAMAWSLSQVLGPTSGTWLASHFGFNSLWWIAACVCLVTGVLFRFLKLQ